MENFCDQANCTIFVIILQPLSAITSKINVLAVVIIIIIILIIITINIICELTTGSKILNSQKHNPFYFMTVNYPKRTGDYSVL